mgnify:CR=1 FL=1
MERPTICGFRAPDDDAFADAARRASDLGATHIVITEDIPLSLWQFDTPGDPYPAWFSHQPGLFKVFPPAAVSAYMDADYSEAVASLFERRCAILRRLGLKAFYWTNEPQVLPESFFAEHPHARGPRVDHPHRSRVARFAPCTDEAEVRDLYRESIQLLLRRCPEVEIMSFLTIDSGSGLCWAESLYPGPNGNPRCRGVSASERVAGFLTTLQSAARDIGHELAIDIKEIEPRSWMKRTFEEPDRIAAALPAGLAVNHREGPDGRPFITAEFMGLHWNELYPIVGLPRPVRFVDRLAANDRDGHGRRLVLIPDAQGADLSFRIWESYRSARPSSELERLEVLRSVAREDVGDEAADDLLAVWLRIEEATALLGTLNFGPVFRMGGLLARWFTRPLVPFPMELTEAEMAHYRPFLFQAKTEAEAANLIDTQAMRMFEGWGARLLTEAAIERARAKVATARAAAEKLDRPVLVARLEVMDSFARTVRNVVAYQAQLDRVQPPAESNDADDERGVFAAVPVLGHQGDWRRQDLLTIARDEMSNALELIELEREFPGQLVDTADLPEQAIPLQLGPDLVGQLQRKVEVMGDHWTDYDRLLTAPNL